MHPVSLKIIPIVLLPEYLKGFPSGVKTAFDALHDAEISQFNFSFYTSVASVFSSKIEGEDIELDSYIKHKRNGIQFKPDYTRKVDDLYDAYIFAKSNPLNAENIAVSHEIMSEVLVGAEHQGTVRKQNMYVATPDGKIEYVAASPFEVEEEMKKFYSDLDTLLKATLTIEESFFFASMVHLVFVKIHPWNDGNGRSARLLEKWFLAQKLGEKAWFMQSEKYYYENHQTYYNNIRALGIEYPELDYSKALPFLLMLPASLNNIR